MQQPAGVRRAIQRLLFPRTPPRRLRVVMAVDGVCRPMVAFACASVLDGSRGDHLTVAKLQPAAK